MAEDVRMTATLRTPEGEYIQVADYAHTFAEMESRVTELYTLAGKRPAGERTYGSMIVRIVVDEYADQLPEWEHIGD